MRKIINLCDIVKKDIETTKSICRSFFIHWCNVVASHTCIHGHEFSKRKTSEQEFKIIANEILVFSRPTLLDMISNAGIIEMTRVNEYTSKLESLSVKIDEIKECNNNTFYTESTCNICKKCLRVYSVKRVDISFTRYTEVYKEIKKYLQDTILI